MPARSAQLTGVQTPRFASQPLYATNAAPEVIDLMAELGRPLDLWQRIALEIMLGEKPSGLWAALEAAFIVARQNGKGEILEARELGGALFLGDQFIIHSAHQYDTAQNAFDRMVQTIESTSWLSRRVKQIDRSHGDQGVEWMNGAEIRYRTRTSGGGRGFSADLLVIDEAQHFTTRQRAAIMPTLSSRRNPQMVYAGTVLPEARLLRQLVDRGRRGGDKTLAFGEWSAPDDADPAALESWLQGNPSAGIRIGLDYIAAEYAAFTNNGTEFSPEFSQERLSIWPEITDIGAVIPVDSWNSCEVSGVTLPKTAPISLGLAISPDRKWSAVTVSWPENGQIFVDLARFAAGTDWTVPFLAAIAAKRGNPVVGVDQGGPAATLLPALGAAGLRVRVATTADYKTACATFVDGVKYKRIAHRGQPELTEAAIGVKEHRVGDGWVFARRQSGVVVAPLEAAALAAWATTPDLKSKEFFVQDLNEYEPAPEDPNQMWVRR